MLILGKMFATLLVLQFFFSNNSRPISATKEVYKDVDKILVFHSDLVSAVSMKARGINPKLILAMPRSESVHLKWLKEKYFYNEMYII